MRLSELGDLYSTLLEAAVDGIITIDEAGIITGFNSAAERLFGYRRDEVIGQNVKCLMPEYVARHHDGYLQNYLQGCPARIIGVGREVEGRHKDGSTFPLHLSVGEALHEGHRNFIGICHDLTSYNAVLRQLGEAEERYRDIVESQKQLICRLDSKLRITFANASFSQVVGVQHDALMGIPLTSIADDAEHQLPYLLAQMFRSSDDLGEVNIKVTMKARDSGALVDWSFKRVESGNSEPPELQGFGIDISQQEAAVEQALYLRSHDPVTGFLNKQAYSDALAAWIQPGRRYALLHIDCSQFERITQQYGFESGDLIMAEAARRLRLGLDRANLCGRVTSDDFVVMAPVIDQDEAQSLANQVVLTLEAAYTIHGEQVRLDTTCGIALYPHDTRALDTLLLMASSAAKDARDHGLAYSYFNPEYHEDLRRQMDIEQGLKEAIDTRAIDVHLQPKFDLATGRIHGYEALVRWTHPRQGAISPALFVPIAERSALGQKLDRYVLTRVAELIAESIRQGKPEPVIAVNITAKHFSDTALSDFIRDLLQTYQIPARSLQLEITEGIVMEMRRTTTAIMDDLRQMGIEVSIDDFGTGYSSLSYLQHLMVDELKIDKIFIDDLESERGATLVRAVIAIAKAHDLRVTAEGIETGEQARILAAMKCDLGQGYFFARPAPSDEVLGLNH
ncbi:EAL domain-containing protein [Marinobacter sp. R17]|uniref:putative bifunctional diguanylate cyclase/phosphodiesterase n=1 Tax=Marinobacter sp. R17 TaxID=2484250 RepID=UPI000F4B882D|nr:EAL domain-containing protein [Marinobacter sp. R17]ROT96398.1 EAL domain-containing protein [Marinobacter sp. R17]